MGTLLILGTVLGANNLAAALALGALGQKPRRWRIVPMFSGVGFAVTLSAMLAGKQVSRFLSEHVGWLAPALLVGFGTWVIWSALNSRINEEAWAARATTLKGSFLLALGLSVDNVVVGFSFGLEGWPPLALAGTAAVFSAVFSLAGLNFGSRLRRVWEQFAEISTGLVLIALGVASATGLI